MAFFSRIKFEPTTAKGIACPTCGGRLTYDRTCLTVMLACQGCHGTFDPARFAADLDDDFDEAYANVPLNRM
ncbi:dual CXXC motif small (seleno)protein [Solidesulfovibrio sp.]